MVSGIKKQISNTFIKPLRCYLTGKLGVFGSYSNDSNDFSVIALNGCQKLLEDVRSCYNQIIYHNKVSVIKKQISKSFVKLLRCYLLGKLGVLGSYSNDFSVIVLNGSQKLLEDVRSCYNQIRYHNKVSGIKKQISNTFVKLLRCYLTGKLGVFGSYSNDFSVIALNECQKLLEDVSSCYNQIR